MTQASLAEQLQKVKSKMSNPEKDIVEKSAETLDEYLKENPGPSAMDIEEQRDRIALLKAQAKREKAALWQSVAMAVLTGASAAAVGVSLWKGSSPEKRVTTLPPAK